MATRKKQNRSGAKSQNKSQKKVKRAVQEFQQGKLRSGSGKKVQSRKQAVAIGLSEARKAGANVPKPTRRRAPAKKK